jgi:biopolymer transport protein ExbB/TolQ
MDTSTSLQSDQPEPVFNWHREDSEQRFGFTGGRFTDTNRNFTFLVALVITCVLYAGFIFVPELLPSFAPLADKFTGRGITPYPILFLTIWGSVILMIKSRKIRFQYRALDLAVVPQDPDLFLTPATAKAVTERVEQMADDYRRSLLLNRIHVALSNLKNVGQVSDVASILNNQSSADEDQIAGSYTLINGFIWAIPVLGFIGTVLGLGQAMAGFGEVLSSGADMTAIRTALQTVTGGLSTAFDTTLIGLVGALFLQMWTTISRREEARLLDSCADYCQTYVLAKLRIIA